MLTLQRALRGPVILPHPGTSMVKVWRPLQCLSRLPPPEDGVTVMLNEALPRSQV